MALLCALAQAPRFPLGWMLRCKNEELRKVVEAIGGKRVFPHQLTTDAVSWHLLSAVVHSHIPEVAERLGLVDKFATFWDRMARQLLSDSHQDEYNALKHGLRVMPGGFSIAFGVEKVRGQRAAPEDMQSLGGSEFGSSFTVPLKIEGAEKHQLRLSRRSRNWSWEALAIDLQLISQSINNVVSCLRVIAGAPAEILFEHLRHRRHARVGVERFPAGDHLVEQHAEAENVGAGIDALAAHCSGDM